MLIALSSTFVWVAAGLAIAAAAACLCAWQLRRRGLSPWIVSYARSAGSRRPPELGRPVHVFLCIADHFEPRHGGVGKAHAAARVDAWVRRYPELFSRFRDSDGRPPRHTFFFPIDEYDASHVEAIAGLCRAGYGEIEIHHHHDNDSAEALRERLLAFKQLFRERHGLLAEDKVTGEVKYAFVHGNWALCNSRPDGRWCGVNNELTVLRETGCYADFTMPSAPSLTQTSKINSIYYGTDDVRRPKGHDGGVDVGAGPRPEDGLMLVQGPLLLNWRSRKAGLLPRIENGNLQGNQPPTMERLDLWLRARVQVPTRPDWFFVKLYTHGATEANQVTVLGEPMVRFHEALARRAAGDPNFHFHYVTAREMYNAIRAAEAGSGGSVDAVRDHELVWPVVGGRNVGARSLASVV